MLCYARVSVASSLIRLDVPSCFELVFLFTLLTIQGSPLATEGDAPASASTQNLF